MTENPSPQSLFDAAARLKACLARALAGGDDPSVSPEAEACLACLEREYQGDDGAKEKLAAFACAMRDPGAFPGLSRAVVIARGQRYLWTLIAALEDEAEAAAPQKKKRNVSKEAERPAPATPFDPALLSLPGVGPKTASRLASRGLSSPEDLLFLLPRRYDDRRSITPIAEVKEGERVVT